MSDTDETPVERPTQVTRVAKCGNCTFYGALDKVCRRDAPKAFPIPSGGPNLQVIAIWTPVDADRDWCGEFQSRDVY